MRIVVVDHERAIGGRVEEDAGRVARAGEGQSRRGVLIAVFDDEGRRGMAVDSLVSGGCIVSGASVRRSLLYSSVRVNSWASLDGAVVRTVFVAPTAQGRGIGAGLMAAVERAAAAGGIAVLTVPSSITARGFYEKLGFDELGDRFHGDERTIIMRRSLKT